MGPERINVLIKHSYWNKNELFCYFLVIINKGASDMKKILILFCLSIFVISVAFAGNVYYTNRNGDILEVGTNFPINKNLKSNLSCNTYSFTYRMYTYYMVKDDGTKYSRKSLLGCEDYSISNLFDPLVLTNDDKVMEKLTADELKKANIRFVKLKSPMGQLDIYNKKNDFNLDNIAYIDLSQMTYYSDNYGKVKMYLKPIKENSYYGPKHMKELIITIQSKSKQQADKMF